MSGKRYPAWKDGETVEINPQKAMMKVACCDCGLVHLINYRVAHRQSLKIRVQRLNGSTGQIRRHRKFPARHVGHKEIQGS